MSVARKSCGTFQTLPCTIIPDLRSLEILARIGDPTLDSGSCCDRRVAEIDLRLGGAHPSWNRLYGRRETSFAITQLQRRKIAAVTPATSQRCNGRPGLQKYPVDSGALRGSPGIGRNRRYHEPNTRMHFSPIQDPGGQCKIGETSARARSDICGLNFEPLHFRQ